MILVPDNWIAGGMPDNLTVSSVPVTKGDLKDGLTQLMYLHRMCMRLRLMIEEAEEPRYAMSEMAAALDQAGVWTGPSRWPSPQEAVMAMALDNPSFLTLLTHAAQLPDKEPFPVRQMPNALAAIKHTTLGDWLSLALPAGTDAPYLA